MNKEPFAKINFGTKPTTSKLEEIDVTIDSSLMLNGYAKAYANELQRRNPTRFDAVNLTETELQMYFEGILAIRIECVNDTCKVWRQAKQLMIPSWIEFVITEVGEVIDTDRGLKFIPHYEHTYDINAMLDVSAKLRAFISDGVAMSQDAFPRVREGDYETMSMAIINDYVQSQTKDSHPISSYVAAFLGFKLKEEATFKMLYRVRYDDIAFIQSMLLREGTIF